MVISWVGRWYNLLKLLFGGLYAWLESGFMRTATSYLGRFSVLFYPQSLCTCGARRGNTPSSGGSL